MYRVNEYRLYVLGQSLAALKHLGPGSAATDIWWALTAARRGLDEMLDDSLPYKVCRPALGALVELIDEVLPRDHGAVTKDLALSDLDLVLSALDELEPVLAAEFDAMDTYVISQKGIFNTADLIEQAYRFLPATAAIHLPRQCWVDLKEAGRCLAFDLDTACGFHLMRATEAAIHEYYVTVTGHAIKRKDRNWGAYVRNLNKHIKENQDSKADRKLIALIDQIREHHRNVLMHPEESLDPGQALGLFGICQSAMIALARGIEAAK